MLDEHLASDGTKLDLVVALAAEQQELVTRLLKRAPIEHRVDDTAETISSRLRIFHARTASVLDDYRDRGIVERVDGVRSPDQVFDQIRQFVDARM